MMLLFTPMHDVQLCIDECPTNRYAVYNGTSSAMQYGVRYQVRGGVTVYSVLDQLQGTGDT